MPELIIYLLKANLVIVLCYLGYYFFLRKLTFYNLNRFYLLIGLLVALVYPLINVADFFNRQPYLKPATAYAIDWGTLTNEVSPKIGPWDILTAIIWIVAVLFALRFSMRLFALWNIHKQSKPSRYTFYQYRKVLLKIDPFSFWKTIYVNPSLHESRDLDDIFKHELTHTNELHTIDVLLVELISVCFWFNPVIWFTRMAIKENLEFITDRKVLESGVDRKSYQYSLVNLMTQQKQSPIANHFNIHALKKRISMMNRKQSSKLNIGKYIFIVPAVAILALTFTVTKAYEEKREIANNLTIEKQPVAVEGTVKKFTENKPNKLTYSKTAVRPKQDTTKGKSTAITFKKDTTAQKTGIRIRDSKLQGKPLYVLDGKPINEIAMQHVNPNDIESISVLKDSSATAIYGPKAINGVVLIATKVKGAEKERIQDSATTIHSEADVYINGEIPKETKFFIDGSSATREEFKKLKPDDIDSINVTKDAGTGKGTINITTKKRSE